MPAGSRPSGGRGTCAPRSPDTPARSPPSMQPTIAAYISSVSALHGLTARASVRPKGLAPGVLAGYMLLLYSGAGAGLSCVPWPAACPTRHRPSAKAAANTPASPCVRPALLCSQSSPQGRQVCNYSSPAGEEVGCSSALDIPPTEACECLSWQWMELYCSTVCLRSTSRI